MADSPFHQPYYPRSDVFNLPFDWDETRGPFSWEAYVAGELTGHLTVGGGVPVPAIGWVQSYYGLNNTGGAPVADLGLGFSAGYPSGGSGGGGGGFGSWGDFFGGAADAYTSLFPQAGTAPGPVVTGGGPAPYVGPGLPAPGVGGVCPTRPRNRAALLMADPCGGEQDVYRRVGKISSGWYPGDSRKVPKHVQRAVKRARPARRSKRR